MKNTGQLACSSIRSVGLGTKSFQGRFLPGENPRKLVQAFTFLLQDNIQTTRRHRPEEEKKKRSDGERPLLPSFRTIRS